MTRGGISLNYNGVKFSVGISTKQAEPTDPGSLSCNHNSDINSAGQLVYFSEGTNNGL